MISESDIRCYELIGSYFEYNNPNFHQEMLARIDFEAIWDQLPQEYRDRIIKIDEEIQARYSRWYNYSTFNQYMDVIISRLKSSGIETPIAEKPLNPITIKAEWESFYPVRDRYSKKQIEYFQRRTEAYLSIWENAEIEDLARYDWENKCSAATARSSLQRVFWGNHLSEGQIFRLLSEDLRCYLHPERARIHKAYIDLIKKVLEYFDLFHFYTENTEYPSPYQPNLSPAQIKNLLNKWDWVTHIWEDENESIDETEEAIEARWFLHLACKHELLNDDQIKELIDLDKAAILCPNYKYFSKFERRYVTQFLLEQGVFEKVPE